jgi:hypothetical protein
MGVGQPLAAWSVADRQELSSVWMKFLREMAASTNKLVQLDGLRLILDQSQDPAELASTAERFAEAAWAARLSIFNREMDVPVGQVLTNLARRVAAWGRPSAERLLTLAQDWSLRYDEQQPDLSYESWKDLIRQLTNLTARVVGFQTPSVPPRPEQVQELIAQFEAVGHQGSRPSAPAAAKVFLDRLRVSAGRAGAGASTPLTNRPPLSDTVTNLATRLGISRAWSLEDVQLPPGRRFSWSPSAEYMFWHQGRLWMETETYEANDRGAMVHLCLVSLDPETMNTQIFEVPVECPGRHYAPRRSLMVEGDMFFCVDGSLWHRSAGGDWNSMALAVPGAQPCWWRSNLVLSSEDSIHAVDPRTGQAHILAGSRRNPAVGALDRVGSLGQAKVMVWPGERLCVLVAGKVWTYIPDRQDWTVLCAGTNVAESLQLDSTGVLYRQSGDRPGLLGGWRPGTSVLEFYAWERGRLPLGIDFTPPLWLHPAGFHPQVCRAAFEGGNIWILPALYVADRWAPLPTQNLLLSLPPRSLLLLDRRYAQALEFRMDFVGQAAAFEKPFDEARKNPCSELEFLPTPAGLAVLLCEGGHLSWIPKADLDKALAEALRSSPQSERPEFAAWSRFDQSKKGWLDDEERRNMRGDAAWSRGQEATLEASIQSDIVRHKRDWETLFASADKNNDGRLSVFELSAAVQAYPTLFDPRLRGVNGPLTGAIRPYDLDNDMTLNLGEFLRFLADPRLVAEVNRSVEWVVKFGLKPSQCDTNDDGIIDPSERAQVPRLIRQRFDVKGTKN